MSIEIAAEPRMTAEEFAARPDPGYPEELVKGRVLSMPPGGARHGRICSRISHLIETFLETMDVGHVLSNDSGVITERGPDSVRGPDVSFYLYDRLPRGPLPRGYPEVVPDAVFEVLSPHDRWPVVLAKVAEYLNAGTRVVVVVDDERRVASVFHGDGTTRLIAAEEELAIPEVLGDFRVPLDRLFE